MEYLAILQVKFFFIAAQMAVQEASNWSLMTFHLTMGAIMIGLTIICLLLVGKFCHDLRSPLLREEVKEIKVKETVKLVSFEKVP